jgi:hypothetical protein
MTASAASGSTSLPTWAEQMRALEPVVDNLLAIWRPEGATEPEIQDMNKLALSMLADGYLCHVYTDARRPVFMPLWNYACNQGGPDPDYVYSSVEIDPEGVYRISGFRGTSRFVEITERGSRMFSPNQVKTGRPVNATNDLDDLTLGEDGSFSVIVSVARPAGYEGNWWPLDPRAQSLLMRRCSCDWTNEIDARVAIERLDDGGADMMPEEIAARFSDMAAWIEGMIAFDMDLVRWYREHHGVNTFMRSKKIDTMGGLPKQAYYDGIYEIDDDEALIIEIEIPEEVRYWQALVSDDRFATVDWVNRQSSINDATAHLDRDGRFRAVVSKRDPGVPNWLDKADWPWGIIQMRINKANRYPDPTIARVALADIRDHLPADTPVVTPAERREQLRRRREGAQLRRIW